jgi:hypothetical protein
VEHVGGYLKYNKKSNIHFVFYERLLRRIDDEIYRLANYLGIKTSQELVDTVKKSVNFSKMKNENPSHVRKGKSGGWQKELTQSQKHTALRVARPMLNMLNYPTTERKKNEMPKMRSGLSETEIDRAIAYSSRKTLKTKINEIYKIIIN